MKKLCTAIFKTGKDHQDTLCVFSTIFAVLFALPITSAIIGIFSNMWGNPYDPTILPYTTTMMFIQGSDILSAAAFAVLAISLLKTPQHPMTTVACGVIALSNWILGIANFVYHYNIMPSQNIFTAGAVNIAADVYAMIVPVIFYTLTIVSGFLWLLPIIVHKAKEHKVWIWVFLPLLLFFCQTILGIFTGELSIGYLLRCLAEIFLITSVSILIWGESPRSALNTIKQLKQKEL